ncbi:MAG: ATP-binding cassette domain-containing protein [Bacillota bacterium]|nr:ATP-binding cassette domain-containing protein [Bacillota bacterium]
MQLELRNITKSFGDVHVLKDISFTTYSGRAMGFLGRNGSGKTTTMRCLMNVFAPDSGKILLDGKPFVADKASIGYLPEERGMYPKEPIVDQLMYFARLRGASKQGAYKSAMYWLERVGLSEYHNKKLEILSKGNQQKIQIIQAFLTDPDILILDEPFSGLDPVNSQLFKEIILELLKQKKLVVFSSHQMAYVEEFCDDIALIHNGRITLSGDLNKIKRERAHRQVLIESPSESASAVLSSITKEKFQRKENVFHVRLPEGMSKEHLLLGLLDQGVKVESFNDYLPSLHQIFLESAGEQ